MPSKPDDATSREGLELTGAEVAAYLRAQPGFLLRNPDLLAALTPPARHLGEQVVDLQDFIIQRLRREVARLEAAQAELIAASRSNLCRQAQVHAAVLALLEATTLDHLIEIVADDLAAILGVDVVTLCVESAGAVVQQPSVPGLRCVKAGTVARLMGSERDVLLRPTVVGDERLFGAAAALVRSDALARLGGCKAGPSGLLALGSRRHGRFQPGHGTEPFRFLARVLEHCVKTWLGVPG